MNKKGRLKEKRFVWRKRVDLKEEVFMKKKGWNRERSFYEEEGLK